jgi:hypothetical protein
MATNLALDDKLIEEALSADCGSLMGTKYSAG